MYGADKGNGKVKCRGKRPVMMCDAMGKNTMKATITQLEPDVPYYQGAVENRAVEDNLMQVTTVIDRATASGRYLTHTEEVTIDLSVAFT